MANIRLFGLAAAALLAAGTANAQAAQDQAPVVVGAKPDAGHSAKDKKPKPPPERVLGAAIGTENWPIDESYASGPGGFGTARITENSIVIRETSTNPFGFVLPDRSYVRYAVGQHSPQTGNVEPLIVVLQDLRGNTMVIQPKGPGADLGLVRFNNHFFGEEDITRIPNIGGDWQARFNGAKNALNDLAKTAFAARQQVEVDRYATKLPDPRTLPPGHVFEGTLKTSKVGDRISVGYHVVGNDGNWHRIDAVGRVFHSSNPYNPGDWVNFEGTRVITNPAGEVISRLSFRGDGQAFSTPFVTRDLVEFGDERQRYVWVSPNTWGAGNNSSFCNIPTEFYTMLNGFNLSINRGSTMITYTTPIAAGCVHSPDKSPAKPAEPTKRAKPASLVPQSPN